MENPLIDKFHRRLKKIGVEVDFRSNYPWVYLNSVNGKMVKGNFHANHGFTAFFLPTKPDTSERFSDRRAVFQKIRDNL